MNYMSLNLYFVISVVVMSYIAHFRVGYYFSYLLTLSSS